ncbi:MAG: hypothetical protein U0229_20740 [Anaeromyxobacter sp.]
MRPALILPALLGLAHPNLAAAGDIEKLLVTDRAQYEAAFSADHVEVKIPLTYTNQSGKARFLPGCKGPPAPVLEKREGARWTVAFGPIELMKEILGHYSVVVTERYAHLTPELFTAKDLSRLSVAQLAGAGGLAATQRDESSRRPSSRPQFPKRSNSVVELEPEREHPEHVSNERSSEPGPPRITRQPPDGCCGRG